MSQIYLVRHGDIQNPQQIVYCRLPGIPLSDLGKQEAHTNALYLKDKQISGIFSSPLERCAETAQILSQELSLPFKVDDRLIEINSPYQGCALVDYRRKVSEDLPGMMNLYT